MNDDELIRRWREGDENAFWELRGRHRPRCFDHQNARKPGWLRRVDSRQVWRDQSDFEDLFDDVLRKTMAVGRYDPAKGKSYGGYLAKSLWNAVNSWLRGDYRRRSRFAEVDPVLADEKGKIPAKPSDDWQDPVWLAARTENVQRVEDAIADLDPMDRDIIFRRYRDEQDYSGIAQAYGVSESTCRSRLERALRRLRRLLGVPDHEE